MSSKRYLEEFRIAAVKQVTDGGYSAPDVAQRLGVSQPTLYEWIKKYRLPEPERATGATKPVGRNSAVEGGTEARDRGARTFEGQPRAASFGS
jgi:transposase-like protein